MTKKETENAGFLTPALVGILYVILGVHVLQTSPWGLVIILLAIGWTGLMILGLMCKLILFIMAIIEGRLK